MERTRRAREESGPGGFDDLLAANSAGGSVTISSGPYYENLPVAGMSVGEIRRRYGDLFDVAPGSDAVVEGRVVGDDTIVRAGECLTFQHLAGEKG